MTVDEELGLLEDNLRRLKVEYDIYFGGGTKKPPTDIDWRVKSLMKKYSDGRHLNFTQRFRYNTLANRYAIYNDLWRQKLKIKEEGYRRPQDAQLAIVGLRSEQEHEAAKELNPHHTYHLTEVSVRCSDPALEEENVRVLFIAMCEAKQRVGAANNSSFESFREFVGKKTAQIRREHGCDTVEYAVEVHEGQVRLKAKAKKN